MGGGLRTGEERGERVGRRQGFGGIKKEECVVNEDIERETAESEIKHNLWLL